MNKSLRTAGVLTAALGLLATLSPSATAQSGGKIVIKAGRIITLSGQDVIGGSIVIEDGRIQAIGTDVQVPWDAEVIDAPELTAFPGFVEAHTYRGMDRPNENVDVAAFLNVKDSIDPVNFYFEDSRRSGVTTINVQHGPECVIGAQGMIVKPMGLTVEQMLVRPESGVKISVSPKQGKSAATQAQALRQTFKELRLALEGLVQEKKDGDDRARREALYQGRDYEGEDAEGKAMKGTAWKVDGLEMVPRVEIDEQLLPLLEIVEGDVPVYLNCENPMDVHTGLQIARENGFLKRTTLVLGPACWKAADTIAEAGVPVVLDPNIVHVERDPVTGDEIETFVPGVFQEKGVRFALQSIDQTNRSLWFQAAMCVGYGMERPAALAAVTTTPAEILGLGKRVGTLEQGKDGNVVLFSGDPLSVTSHVEYVVIEGDVAYDRSKDTREQHLREGVRPPNTAPSDELDGGSGDGDGDDGDDGDDEEDEDGGDDDGDKDGEDQ